jgi:hypothetical protein
VIWPSRFGFFFVEYNFVFIPSNTTFINCHY